MANEGLRCAALRGLCVRFRAEGLLSYPPITPKGVLTMSDEKKIDTTPEEEGELSPELAAILADYRAELDELYENRRRRAKERENMTEEEIIAAMTSDLEAVLADATENGMDIITIGDDDEDEGEEEGGEA